MKRIIIALVALAAIFVATACQPPTLTNAGFTKARTPNRTGIILANPSAVNGHDMIESAKEWNAIAGWGLLNVAPVNDPHWLVHADIRFGVWTVNGVPAPIYGHNGQRVAAWVQPFFKPDGSMDVCAIWYDPLYVWNPAHPQRKNPDLFSHEIGHCLGFIGGADDKNEACASGTYAGVMSYCNFWGGMNDWWSQHDGPWWDQYDVQMLAQAGYR